MISEIAGSSVRIRSSISLARECASASGTLGSSPSVRKTTSPSSVWRNRSSRGAAPVCSRTIARRRPPRRARPPPRGAPPLRLLGQRLEVRLHGVHPRQRLLDRLLDLARDGVRLVERELARQLQVQRDLGSPVDAQDADVVDLAHARNAHRRRMRELARDRVLLGGLDVDDDVRLRAARAESPSSTRVGGRVPLPDRRARRDRDHDVGEVAPGRRADPQPPQRRPAGSIPAIAALAACSASGRRAVHQHVDVPPHQPQRCAQHERRRRTARRPSRRPPSPPWPRSGRPARRASRRSRCRNAVRSRAAPRCGSGARSAAR